MTIQESTLTPIKRILEAALMTAGEPLSIRRLQQLFAETEAVDPALIKAGLTALSEDYQGRGVQLQEVATGYRFQAAMDLQPWIERLWQEKPQKYSKAVLETLALIAYRQPITRGGIEAVRGVTVSRNVLKTLLDREWVHVVGHREVPGRPALYGTTKKFLDDFNLTHLEQLPEPPELIEPETDEEISLQDTAVTTDVATESQNESDAIERDQREVT